MKNEVYQPKRYLGQNFLTDKRIQEKIIQACELKADDVIVEIGPGQGVLTRLIAPQVKRLICVETDRDLIEPLQNLLKGTVEGNSPLERQGTVPCKSHSIDIVHADFLKWDMGDLPTGIKVIGNIPYYISTPIIEKLITDRKYISSAFLTVQLEFGERLVAKHGGKEYGSLTCFAQYYADIKLLFKIKNTCFKPAPKVDSCFLRLDLWSKSKGTVPLKGGGQSPSASADLAVDEEFLFKLIQTAFQQRRKNIVNTLKGLVGKEKLEMVLQSLKIDLNARPENLTLKNYIELSNRLMI